MQKRKVKEGGWMVVGGGEENRESFARLKNLIEDSSPMDMISSDFNLRCTSLSMLQAH